MAKRPCAQLSSVPLDGSAGDALRARPDQCHAQAPAPTPAAAADDPIQKLIARLDLPKYKATIRGLTKFGDRRQGTDRNRPAIDWIEAQLKSYGCTNTERIHYTYTPPPPRGGRGGRGGDTAGRRRWCRRGAVAEIRAGGRIRGDRATSACNNDPDLQPDTRLRELNSQPSTPGPREEVYCTKIGTTHPEEMYIVGAHMDGIGWGEAANDDGSGTALVMEDGARAQQSRRRH